MNKELLKKLQSICKRLSLHQLTVLSKETKGKEEKDGKI